jgi:hypothetical protein
MLTLHLACSMVCARKASCIVRAALLALAVFALGYTHPAHAEEIGAKGNLVIGAERLFGVYIDNQTIDRGNAPSAKIDHIVFGLGWGSSAESTLTTPRLGIDYFLGPAFTLGGNFGFVSHNIDAGTNQSNTNTGLLLGARAGYALRLGHAISFWPRGGLTFITRSGDNHVVSLSLDAPFTLSPSEGFAILAGPCLELGLIGTQSRADYTEVMFGVMAGLAGWTGL